MKPKLNVLSSLLLLAAACAPKPPPPPPAAGTAAAAARAADGAAAPSPAGAAAANGIPAAKATPAAKAAPAAGGAEATIGAAAIEDVARGVSLSGTSPEESAAETAAGARLRAAFSLPSGSKERRAALDGIRHDLGLDYGVALRRFAGRAAEPARLRAQALLAMGELDRPPLDAFELGLDDPAPVVRAASAAALGRTFRPVQRVNPKAVLRLLGGALKDRAPEVQAAALQALSDRDAGLLRGYLAGGPRADLARVARQLLVLAEERGAPLVPDAAGALSLETSSGVILRYTSTRRFAKIGASEGVLTAERPGKAPVQLARAVEVVGNVLPAAVSADGRYVAYEAARAIHVRDLEGSGDRTVGPGIAPRPEPFGDGFIYLRQVKETPLARVRTELTYAVLSSAFAPADAARQGRLGELLATPSMTLHGNYSPARWMRVVETGGHFALEGEGVRTFALPDPFGDAAP